MRTVTLRRLGGEYAICRLEPRDPIPPWADGPGFVSVSRTDEELSIVCLKARVPTSVRHEDGWKCLMLVGPFAFEESGIVLSVVKPLSEAGLSIFVVSTFDCDYLLVKARELAKVLQRLQEAGHSLERSSSG